LSTSPKHRKGIWIISGAAFLATATAVSLQKNEPDQLVSAPPALPVAVAPVPKVEIESYNIPQEERHIPSPSHSLASESVASVEVLPPLDLKEIWNSVVAPGDTLGSLLEEAHVEAGLRQKITEAIAKVLDLERLMPGQVVRITFEDPSHPASLVIELSDGSMLSAKIGNEVSVELVESPKTTLNLARELTVEGSVYSALGSASAPTLFATSISNALSGVVDFRRDLSRGDVINLVWSEDQTDDGDTIGQPAIRYAKLHAMGDDFEVVWGDKRAESPLVFRNGDLIHSFVAPIPGARISSTYGMRTHPIYKRRILHAGTDFAATTGTPIRSSAAGTVSYVGRRSGYGRVVEVSHSSSVKTRYAHMSKYESGIKKDTRVQAGDRIGYVGSSGRVTGPHLHYEFILNGKQVDPMAEGRWNVVETSSNNSDQLARLNDARKLFSKTLRVQEGNKSNQTHATIAMDQPPSQ